MEKIRRMAGLQVMGWATWQWVHQRRSLWDNSDQTRNEGREQAMWTCKEQLTSRFLPLSGAGTGTLQPMGQMQHSRAHCLVLPVVAFLVKQQNWVISKETKWATKSKIHTVQAFTEKTNVPAHDLEQWFSKCVLETLRIPETLSGVCEIILFYHSMKTLFAFSTLIFSRWYCGVFQRPPMCDNATERLQKQVGESPVIYEVRH